MAQSYNNDGNGTAHIILRIAQILTLIPAWAVLAVVISHYSRNDTQTPGAIQFLFVVAILASVWAFCVLITFIRARNTALWMTFFDVVAMALLIAAVVVLSNIANVECVVVRLDQVSVNPDGTWWDARRLQIDGTYTYLQHCAEVKAAWGLAIANIIFFFITAILTAAIYLQNRRPPVVRERIIEKPSPVYAQPSPLPPPSPVHYYESPRRHSRGHRSHRSHSLQGSHRSHHRGSYYEGSRRGSQGPDYYV